MRKNKKAKLEPVVDVAPVQEPVEALEKPARAWVVNCPKCGASLNLKEGGQAYICPVCKTLLRMKTGVKLVKDLGAKEKNYHVTLTESAVNALLAKQNVFGLEALVKASVSEGYQNGDALVLDADANGVLVKKA